MTDSLTICNSGPLIYLAKLNRLDLLASMYGSVLIPRAVYDEVVVLGRERGHADALTIQLFLRQQRWPISVVAPETMAAYQPPVTLDPGELEVLALAKTVDDPLVLLDDDTARKEARRLGLRVRGTLGVLVQARRTDLITLSQAELLIIELFSRPDVWLSSRLCEQVIEQLQREA